PSQFGAFISIRRCAADRQSEGPSQARRESSVGWERTVTIDKNSDKILPGIADRPIETVSDEDKKALIMAVRGTFDTLFNWNYEQGGSIPIDALYKKAKMSQWDSDLDIDWSVGGQ